MSCLGSSQTMAKDYLFVYGTLRSETESVPYRSLIAPNCHLMGRADIRGRLFEIDGYPGLLPSLKKHERVVGEVHRFTSRELLQKLDEYEGTDYLRRKCRVTLDDGTQVAAWTYIYRRRVNPFKRINSGDYLNRQSAGKLQNK